MAPVCVTDQTQSSVLRSYETWGEQCLAHIDGDFALAIWNARTREAFCARDRTGRKPFYYAPSATCLAFASEFGTLLQLGFVSQDFNNDDIVGTLLTGGQSFTQTLVKGIVRLPPACLMTVRDGTAQPRRYWDIDCFAELRYQSEGDYEEHFRQVIGDAVRRRLRSASPVGVYVSGGLDSSAVLCVASAQTADRRALCSLSATFPGLACDESSHIAAANSKAGVTGYLFPFLPPRGEFYVEQVWRFSDVCDSPNAAPLNALRAFAQQTGIRVALTGHGADELLGRNPHYYRELLREHGYRALAAQAVLDARRSGALLPVLRGAIGAGIRRYQARESGPRLEPPEKRPKPISAVGRTASPAGALAERIDYHPAPREWTLQEDRRPDTCVPARLVPRGGVDTRHRDRQPNGKHLRSRRAGSVSGPTRTGVCVRTS